MLIARERINHDYLGHASKRRKINAPDEVVLEAVGGLCIGGEAVQGRSGGVRCVARVTLLRANLLVQTLVQVLRTEVL